MKQKRKVKSLIPQKKFTSKSLKTAGLVFLGSALYLASITLLSTSVAFGANEGAQAITFTGFDWNSPITDKKEVVYAARFATIENLNNRIIDIFMNKDGVLYITPNPVIVNPLDTNDQNIISHQHNKVEGVSGHILGGDYNEVHSNNVTIIAGEGNKVKTGSDNATMLGGENNTINKGNGVPSAIIGGSKNTIDSDHNGSNVIIGGNNNTIKSEVSGSAILGGESNTIESNTANAIIGGSYVTNEKNNVFAYSNENDFEPENPNSFFLNMKKGVGINMEASGALNGLYVSGAVSLGDININSKPCNPDNYGLEGKYKGCLVGCTKDGWKMFDRGAKCEKICNGDNPDIFKECPRDAAIPDSPDDYTAFCTGLANTDNATQCPGFETQMQNYKNVVFETKLVDNGNCPESEDKCIFQCNTGFHLTGLITNGYNSSYKYKKCYEDCYYPWDTYKTGPQVPTNTIITGYDMESVACSSVNAKHDNCGKHKQTLICYNNKRYNYDKENKKRNPEENTGHKYEKCTTTEYTCESSYDLNKEKILNTLNDTATENGRKTEDRSTTTLTRGKYKLCLDYDPQSDHDLECLERDRNNNPHNEHYQFIECNSEYDLFTGTDGIPRCMQRCTFDTSDNGPIEIKHGETKDLYSSSGANCPAICEKETFKCNDGKWENAEKMNTYKYDNCTLYNEKERDPSFNIDKQTYDYRFSKGYTKHTEYESQTISIVKNQNNECKDETKYKIVGCEDHYHISPTLKYCIKEGNRGECEPLVDYSHRTDSDDEPFQSTEFGTLYRYAGSTRAEKVWTSWDDPTTESRNKCHSDCDPGFTRRKTGGKNYCVKDGKCPTNPNDPQCPNGKNPNIIRSEQYGSSWTCPGQGVGSRSSDTCHFCADDYEWDGNVCYQCDDGYWDGEGCVGIVDGQCHNDVDGSWLGTNLSSKTSDTCYYGEHQGISEIHDNNGKTIGYTWDCAGTPIGVGDWGYGCHKCEPGYTWEGDTCVKCDGTNCECIDCVTPVNGKCNTGTTINNRWPQNDKDLCTEGEPKHKNGPNDNKYTWDCIGTGGGTSENGCFRCKNGTILSGNKCVNPTTNAECGNSNGKTYTQDSFITDKCTNSTNTPITYDIQTSKWSWNCYDAVGSVPCSATKLECGDASGKNYSNINQIDQNLKCKPSNSNSTSIDNNNNEFTWRCKGDGNSEKKCTAYKVNYACSKTYTNAYLIPGSDSNLTEPTTSRLYDNETAAGNNKCAYVCITGYHKDGDECKINTCSKNTPGENTIRGSGTPSTHNKTWDYKNSTTLGACEWTCKDGYTRAKDANGNRLNKCVEKQCGTTGLPSSMNGVLTGKSTYVGTDNNRNWQYNTSLGACQWKCDETYILNDAGNGCRKIENATCGTLGYTCGEQTSYVKESNKFDTTNSTERIWKCTSKDGIDSNTCTYSCPSGRTLKWDSLHNGACVKEKLECVAGEWGEYDVTYPLPEDAKQNSNKYIVNRILPDFNIENDSNEWTYYQNETPIYYYNGQILTDWEYYGTDKSCAWTCADGYHINDKNNPTECIKDIVYPTCGVVKMGLQEGIHFYDLGIDWGGACPGDGDYLVAGSKNENGRMSENGCGEQAYTWTCRNNDSGLSKRCPYKKKMGYFDVHFQKGSSFDSTKLGEITISRQFGLGQFAFNVVFTDSYGNKSTVTLSAPGDVQSVNYDIKKSEGTPNTYYTNLDPYSKKVTYYIGGIQGSIEKIEFSEVTDQTYVIGAYKGIDAISFIKDSIGNSNCPGFDNTIYPYY